MRVLVDLVTGDWLPACCTRSSFPRSGMTAFSSSVVWLVDSIFSFQRLYPHNIVRLSSLLYFCISLSIYRTCTICACRLSRTCMTTSAIPSKIISASPTWKWDHRTNFHITRVPSWLLCSSTTNVDHPLSFSHKSECFQSIVALPKVVGGRNWYHRATLFNGESTQLLCQIPFW